MGTCRPGAFKKPERNENNQPEIIKEDIHTPESEIRTKVLDSSRHVRTTICVSMRQMSLYPRPRYEEC